MATCCIHCGVEEGELHLSDCPELRSAFERIERERDELQHRLERWQRNEVQIATNQQVARLIRERDEARAEVERLRDLLRNRSGGYQPRYADPTNAKPPMQD